MSEKTYYQRKRDVILNRTIDYHENDNERLRQQAIDKYRNFSEEEKTKRENMKKKNRYHNMPEKKKERLKECQKKYRETKKSQYDHQ